MKLKNFLSQGFTLIELLIVVAIIAILVGIGVPTMKNAKIDAQNAKKNAITAQVATAKSRLFLDTPLASTVTAWNLKTDEQKLQSLANYINVNGAPLSNTAGTYVATLLQGTGSGNISVGNMGDDAAMTAPVISL